MSPIFDEEPKFAHISANEAASPCTDFRAFEGAGKLMMEKVVAGCGKLPTWLPHP